MHQEDPVKRERLRIHRSEEEQQPEHRSVFPRPTGQALEPAAKGVLEPRFGHSLANIRIHADAQADQLTQNADAAAMTVGQDVFFRQGRYDPGSDKGMSLLTHEVAHTVQNRELPNDWGDRKLALTQPGDVVERGARNAASEVMAGSFAPSLPALSGPVLARLSTEEEAELPVQAAPAAAKTTDVTGPIPTKPAPDPGTDTPEKTPQERLDQLVKDLMAVINQDKTYQDYAAQAIPLILKDALGQGVSKPEQVAYILATAYHESRFGVPKYSRSESMVEDHNQVQYDDSKKKTGAHRKNHVTGKRSEGESLTDYYDDAYGGKIGNEKGTSDGADFRGRGFVQLTGRGNYEDWTKRLKDEKFEYEADGQKYGGADGKEIDLAANPEHVNKVPALASHIMVEGMVKGTFRSRVTGTDPKTKKKTRDPNDLGDYINDEGTDYEGAREIINGDGKDNGATVAGYAKTFAAVLNKDGVWASLVKNPPK
jgi:predicted chitinase